MTGSARVCGWGPGVSAPRLLCGNGPRKEKLLGDCERPEHRHALCPEPGHLEPGHLEPGHPHGWRARPPAGTAGSCRGRNDHYAVPQPRPTGPPSSEHRGRASWGPPPSWGLPDGMRPGNTGDDAGAPSPGPLCAKNLTRRTACSLPFARRLHWGAGMKWQWPNPTPPPPPGRAPQGGRGAGGERGSVQREAWRHGGPGGTSAAGDPQAKASDLSAPHQSQSPPRSVRGHPPPGAGPLQS